MPAELLDFLDRHAAGCPFLIEETLGGLLADGSLTRSGEQWQLDPGATAGYRQATTVGSNSC